MPSASPGKTWTHFQTKSHHASETLASDPHSHLKEASQGEVCTFQDPPFPPGSRVLRALRVHVAVCDHLLAWQAWGALPGGQRH